MWNQVNSVLKYVCIYEIYEQMHMWAQYNMKKRGEERLSLWG